VTNDADIRAVRGLVREGGAAWDELTDVQMSRRCLAVVALVVGLAVLVLLPFTPLPPEGLVIAGALVLVSFAGAARLVTAREHVTPRLLFAFALTTTVAVGALEIAAGAEAPFNELTLLLVVWASVAAAPARLAVLLAAAVLGAVPALLDAGAMQLGESVLHVVIWLLISGLGVFWGGAVRVSRRNALLREEHARRQARRDPLTGLGNRRGFDEVLGREVERSRREREPLSIVVCDLNDFKLVNDVHGHQAGDDCLQQVAFALTQVVRAPDACFRWGGDEFAVILPAADAVAASAVAARIAARVHSTARRPDGRPMTIGVGTATLRDGTTAEELLAEADEALLSVKELSAA
jgi:diguanylate cyclase (GGDEF)-like protein